MSATVCSSTRIQGFSKRPATPSVVQGLSLVPGMEVSFPVCAWGMSPDATDGRWLCCVRPMPGITGRAASCKRFPMHLSLSRLNHWPPRSQAHPEIMQGTADFHHPIADALLPQVDPVFDHAATLDTAFDMLDPQSARVE